MGSDEEVCPSAPLPDEVPRTSSFLSSKFFSASRSLPAFPSSDVHGNDIHSSIDPLGSNAAYLDSRFFASANDSLDFLPAGLDYLSSSTEIYSSTSSSYLYGYGNGYSEHGRKSKELVEGPELIERHVPFSGEVVNGSPPSQVQPVKSGRFRRSREVSYGPTSASLTNTRTRSYDVYIGFHGTKPSLLRFADWLRTELEVQGISCFVVDRARHRDFRKLGNSERTMDFSTLGVVILTKKSFKSPYCIEELQLFSGKKNLVPIYFDLRSSDCNARDIIEKRRELWEKHGGELWMFYGGFEKEWKEAVEGLSVANEWNLEACDGKWRDCIFRAVVHLASRLGRRNVVERLNEWREKFERLEFPFPRNENFVGRQKELSELELSLFGTFVGDSMRYYELKERHVGSSTRNKNSSEDEQPREQRSKGSSRRKGKEPVVWKESEKEIELQGFEFSQGQHQLPGLKIGGRHARRRSAKNFYGKGIACVSGESGVGKTELLLEFAYQYHQRYKAVLWVGGESRYIRQNYLNLQSFLEIDVGIESGPYLNLQSFLESDVWIESNTEKSRTRSFDEQEEAAISRVRKELMRNIPFLVIIDNLESEKDWWDHKLIMDLLPRFGSETHILISTRLPRVMNIEPLKLSCLYEVEAMSLLQGSCKDYPNVEIDVLRVIGEKLGKITLGLAIVGAILSVLPINPSMFLSIITRIPLRDVTQCGREGQPPSQNIFLLQLLEACFLIFDHADGPRSLATRMIEVSGWFAPTAIPISLLALAAHKMPEKSQGTLLWKKILHAITHGMTSSYTKKTEAEAASMLVRLNIARSSTKPSHLHFNELIRLYAQKRGEPAAGHGMVQAVISRGCIGQHSEHMWAACFLVFGFGNESKIVKIKVSELLFLVKRLVLPLAIHTFATFSRCGAAVELLRECTDALEEADQAFVKPVDNWLGKSLCWKPMQTKAQLNPYLWQDLALSRATVLEMRAQLMLKGGHFDIGNDLIRKALFIRTSVSGEDHPDTVAAHDVLSKLAEVLANVQRHTSL